MANLHRFHSPLSLPPCRSFPLPSPSAAERGCPTDKHELVPFRYRLGGTPASRSWGKRFSGCLWGRSAASLKHEADVPKKLGKSGCFEVQRKLVRIKAVFLPCSSLPQELCCVGICITSGLEYMKSKWRRCPKKRFRTCSFLATSHLCCPLAILGVFHTDGPWMVCVCPEELLCL